MKIDMSKKSFTLVFVLITLLSVLLRFYQLGQIPSATYWDETAMIMDARSIVATGKDIHGNSWLQTIFPSYGDYKLPVYIWAVSLAVKVFGPVALAVRLPSAIAGVLTVVLAGLIAKELIKDKAHGRTGQAAQLLTMLVVGLSPWSIMFSRVGFEGHLGQLLLGFSFYLTLKAHHKPWLFLPVGLLSALALFTYYSTRFVWPIGFLILIMFSLMRGKASQQNWQVLKKKSLLGALVAIALFLLANLVMSNSPHYAASQQFRLSSASILDQAPAVELANSYRSITGNQLIDRVAFHRYFFTVKQLLKNYSQHLSPSFMFQTGDLNLRHGTGRHSLFPLVFLPLIILGAVSLAAGRKLGVLVVLVSWWLAGLLPASVPLDVPHALRSLNALIPVSIMIGIGATTLFQTKLPQKKLLLIIFFLLLCFETASFFHYYLKVYPTASATAFQGGYDQLASSLLEEKDRNNQIWVNIDDPRFYLWLLANPHYLPQTIQAWPKTPDFQVTHVENIVWDNFIYTNFNPGGGKFILAGKRAEVMTKLKQAKITPTAVESIFDNLGVERFVLAHLN